MSAKANPGALRAIRRATRQGRQALHRAPRFEAPWGDGSWHFMERAQPLTHEPVGDAFEACTAERSRSGPAPAWGWA